MTLDIDTLAIRRLRDSLVSGDAPADQPVASATVSRALLRRVEPFAETMYLVMMADGESELNERRAIRAAVSVLTQGQIDTSVVDDMLARFDAALGEVGVEGRLAQIGAWISSDPDDRETAFALAAVVALADDRFDVRENETLEWVSEYYGISTRRVQAILHNVG